MVRMGCVGSTRVGNHAVLAPTAHRVRGETIVAALSRLDDEITAGERLQPAARLAVVTAELDVIQQEIDSFEETSAQPVTKESYAQTMHQLFVSLDLYRRPMLVSENEDFVANVNRKELHKLELSWLRSRFTELQKEKTALHAQLLHIRNLYAQLQQLLEHIWGNSSRPGTPQEGALKRAASLRDALSTVSARLRASAEYAHSAVRLLDDALPAWKFTNVGKSGWTRTNACADSCALLVRARCLERSARRVLSAPAAPRAARTLRLALDYAFTDAMHDHKYHRATEVFLQFKEALVQLIDSIHQVPPYYTVLQALKRERLTVPTFCFHERLSIAGNCRMCLVYLEKSPKLQLACASNVIPGMKIWTNTPAVAKAQESVLEFLLFNHPLDCPICDQGGECDLQDLSMKFGNDRTRFTDVHFLGKRAVEDKDLGPLIRTEMTRCIHCTRCIRFASQVCGLDVLGTSGRGSDVLVGTYVDKMFLSELSGNVIDLCPVGALTAIPYMFRARPWELRRTNSIDVTDATGTNIVINHRFDRVLRVLPREHDEINQEWLSDKGRWAIDSLEMQRLVSPMRRVDQCLFPLEWEAALALAAGALTSCCPDNLYVVAGPHCNVETMVAAKDLINLLGSEHAYVGRNLNYAASGADIRAAYSLNINMSEIERADKILLIGTNPRFEAPILNAWIRQAYIDNECDIYTICPQTCEFNYKVCHLGDTVAALKAGCEVMCGAKNPLIFVGISQFDTENGGVIMSIMTQVAESLKSSGWEVLHVIGREASYSGALEVGYKPGAVAAMTQCPPAVMLCLGADEVFYDLTPSECCIIYIGFQGDRGSEMAQIVLPGCAYTEGGGTYLNMEGRGQKAMPAVTPPGNARRDWKIIRALAEYCGAPMFYTDEDSLYCRMSQISPNLVNLGTYQDKVFSSLLPQLVRNTGCGGCIEVEMKTLREYYCADVFTYNSKTMVRAQKAFDVFCSSPYNTI